MWRGSGALVVRKASGSFWNHSLLPRRIAPDIEQVPAEISDLGPSSLSWDRFCVVLGWVPREVGCPRNDTVARPLYWGLQHLWCGRTESPWPASGTARSELSVSLMSAVAPQGNWGHSQASAGHLSASGCATKGFWDFYGPQVLFFFLSFFIYCNWVVDFTNVQNHGKERSHSLLVCSFLPYASERRFCAHAINPIRGPGSALPWLPSYLRTAQFP